MDVIIASRGAGAGRGQPCRPSRHPAGDFNQGIGYLFADPVAFDVSKTLVLSPVPEPKAAVLMLGGIAGLMAWRRRRA